MNAIRVAINGFGRIGRVFFRQAFYNPNIEIVAINDPNPATTEAHLLEFDSVYGHFNEKITTEEDAVIINGKRIPSFTILNPKELPWAELNVDLVIEASGVFRTKERANWHREAGAKKVLITAPPQDEIDAVICMGINEEIFDVAHHHIISNASCTTNSLAPVVRALHETFGIARGFMTTIHSYTNDQATLDSPHKDLRRARAAALNIIPTTTGAAEAVTKVIPELKGKLTGMALRVPTPVVSITDFTVELQKTVDKNTVNKCLENYAENQLKGILSVSHKPLVSMDFKKSSFSSIVDGPSTMVIENNLVKTCMWYDNEWGYSSRLVDLTVLVGQKMNS